MFNPLRLALMAILLALPVTAAQAHGGGNHCEASSKKYEAAQAGDREAQNELGRCLLRSKDQAKRAEARKWFKAAMDSGDVEAKSNYAYTLLAGVGGAEDTATAQKLLEEAAAAGSYGAQLSLAEHYLHEDGFYPKDESKALKLLTDAATGGKMKGKSLGLVQWRIGMMHLDGQGTDKDSEAAFRWVTKAADSGATRGMISQAVMLATGDGTQEDDLAARRMYEKAVAVKDENWPHALRALGGMHWFAEGGPLDRAKGCAYLNAAYVGGDELAEKMLTQISGDLSEAEKKACAKGADRWIKANVAGGVIEKKSAAGK